MAISAPHLCYPLRSLLPPMRALLSLSCDSKNGRRALRTTRGAAAENAWTALASCTVAHDAPRSPRARRWQAWRVLSLFPTHSTLLRSFRSSTQARSSPCAAETCALSRGAFSTLRTSPYEDEEESLLLCGREGNPPRVRRPSRAGMKVSVIRQRLQGDRFIAALRAGGMQ